VGGVLNHDRLAVDLAHEAGFLTAMRFVKADEMAAELWLKHVRQKEDRRLDLNARETLGRRQFLEIAEQGVCLTAIRREWDDA
jgi:hypothetical protein